MGGLRKKLVIGKLMFVFLEKQSLKLQLRISKEAFSVNSLEANIGTKRRKMR
jgi:hypothetical protein